MCINNLRVTAICFVLSLFCFSTVVQADEFVWDLREIDPSAYLRGEQDVRLTREWFRTRNPGFNLPMLLGNGVVGISPERDIVRYTNALTFERSESLYAGSGELRDFSTSGDGNTIALIIRGAEDRLISLFIRKRVENGFFSAPRRIYTVPYDWVWISSVRLSYDGDVVCWHEHRMNDHIFAMRSIAVSSESTRPVEIAHGRSLSDQFYQISGDGRHVVFYAHDTTIDIESGIKNVAYHSQWDGINWTQPELIIMDGEVNLGFVDNINYDGSMIRIGRRVAEWDGAGYRTRFRFDVPRDGFFAVTMAEDGNSIVFLSQDYVPPLSRYEQVVEPTNRETPTSLLVFITYHEDDLAELVRTHIIDEGYVIEYHYERDGSRLLWTKQEEDPFRVDGESNVSDWPQQ